MLFAVSLFFAGIGTRLGDRRFQLVIPTCGWIVFLGTLAWAATPPVSVSF